MKPFSLCPNRSSVTTWIYPYALAVCGLAAGGCQSLPPPSTGQAAEAPVASAPVPRELCKSVLPTYVIEPPDILMIHAVHVVPRPPYRLRSMDVLSVQVQGLPSDTPIAGYFQIEPGGTIRLGPRYGAVRVAGLTLEEAEAAITQQLRQLVRAPVVSLGLAEIASKQQIAGQHLVGPDGTVTLGSFGCVRVVGMTVPQAKMAIEEYLSQFLDCPEISLEVYAFNSKVYYIVTQGAGLGDAVYRFPLTGNETVLDAIAQINGLNPVCSKRIWIARPTDQPGKVQVLPIEWEAITAQGTAITNYQLFPGDRVFVAEDKLVALDTSMAKLFAPFERAMGFSLLGVGTVTRFSGHVLQGGGNPGSNF